MRFSSKRDWWIVAVGIMVIVVLIGRGVLDANLPLLLRGILAMLAILFIWIGIFTNYTIIKEHLLVRCGPLTWKIAFSQITKIQPNDSITDYFFIKGPALSADRLDIKYKKDTAYYSLLVSPDKKDEFINILQARCSNLTR